MACYNLSFLPTACALSRGCIFEISKRWQKLDEARACVSIDPLLSFLWQWPKNDEEGNAEQGSVHRPISSIYSRYLTYYFTLSRRPPLSCLILFAWSSKIILIICRRSVDHLPLRFIRGMQQIMSYSVRTGLSRCCEERAAGSSTNNAPHNIMHVNLFRATVKYLPFEKCWSKQWHYCSIARRNVKIEQAPRWSLNDTIHRIRDVEAPKRSEADVLS